MCPGAIAPRGLVPRRYSRFQPLLPPTTGVRGPSPVPCAEGLPGASPQPRVLTPQQEQGGGQCHRRRHHRRHRAHRRGPGCPGITPSPRFLVPSPHSAGAPPRCARGSQTAEPPPTRLRLPVTSRRRCLAPPSGGGAWRTVGEGRVPGLPARPAENTSAAPGGVASLETAP